MSERPRKCDHNAYNMAEKDSANMRINRKKQKNDKKNRVPELS
jgi:hypothetical protein